MNTCDTCKHWSRIQHLSCVVESGTVLTIQGPRNVIHTETLGNCDQIVSWSRCKRGKMDSGVWDIIEPLHRIVHQDTQRENQWGSGGVEKPKTGPKFGCIHWEAKES